MANENANPEIIAGTNREHLNFVRLYFRPRTPTQYVNEGIKPPAGESEEDIARCRSSSCSTSIDVVGRDDARFSRGTLASYRHGHSNKRDYFLNTIPWRDVYADGLPRSDAAKKARAAEVVIPGSLPIGPVLKGIFCRSPGERVTLMDGLADGVDAVWAKKIRTGFAGFFFDRYPYILNVSGREGRFIDVEFSTELFGRQGVVHVHIEGEAQPRKWEGKFTDNKDRKTFRLREWHEAVHVSVFMEDCLAYRGRVVLGDLPF